MVNTAITKNMCTTCKQLSKEQQTQVLCTLLCMNTETFLSTWIFFILLTIVSKEIIKKIFPYTFKIVNYVKNNYLNLDNSPTRKGKL